MASQLVKLYSLLDDLTKNPSVNPSPSAVMGRISQAFLAALRSLSKSTLALRQLFKSWLVCMVRNSQLPSSCEPKAVKHKTYEEFALDVETLFGGALEPAVLFKLSEGLRQQYKDALHANPQCMLPSYNHQLPNGRESGKFLALDVGGSTFRVALVELRGADESESDMRIVSLKAYKITNAIKQLKGLAFFDWMAIKIKEMLADQIDGQETTLSMGLSWSFPVEQTSLRSGLIQGMGKGFLAAEGLLGQDLGDVIQQACHQRDIKVELKAIVNDSTATLLTKSYTNPSTRFGLILGTGVNMAVHLPVSSFGHVKFGDRPASWHEAAEYVLVNTECSMFGEGILPLTRWDIHLNDCHVRPGFQPFEHLVGGRYIGEIARLALIEGIESANLFDGVVPPSLQAAYTLDTELLANLSSSSSIKKACALFASHHPAKSISESDIKMLQLITHNVTNRGTAVLAACIHALWQLRVEAEELYQGHKEVLQEKNMIACNGSVIQSYPGFRLGCQKNIDTLVEMSGGEKGLVELTIAVESSLLGAAVAVACIDSKYHLGMNSAGHGN